MNINKILSKKFFKSFLKKNEFIFNIFRQIYGFYSYLNLKYFSGSNKDIFTNIYFKNKWGDNNSFSGSGSNLEQTSVILDELPKIIRKYKISSILDLPCGDFYWMKEFDFKEINYIGSDIVKRFNQ